jgi:hypothetical protein
MANPSANGTGVIIGVSDLNVLDIYHPDFWTAGGEFYYLFFNWFFARKMWSKDFLRVINHT